MAVTMLLEGGKNGEATGFDVSMPPLFWECGP